MKIMNAKGLTQESLKSATPEPEAKSDSPRQESHSSGRGAGRGGR